MKPVVKCSSGFWDQAVSVCESTGVKIYTCALCGHVTNRKDSLQTHVLRKHSALKPHKCTTCGKAFKTKGDLRSHLLVHRPPKML